MFCNNFVIRFHTCRISSPIQKTKSFEKAHRTTAQCCPLPTRTNQLTELIVTQ